MSSRGQSKLVQCCFLLPMIGCVGVSGSSGTFAQPPIVQTIEFPSNSDSPPDASTTQNLLKLNATERVPEMDSDLLMVDASSTDQNLDAGVKNCTGPVVAHCLTDMATYCAEFGQNDTIQCLGLGAIVSPGMCGNDASSALSRSSGGCMDSCGLTDYYYPIGGQAPTSQDRETIRQLCQSKNLIFISTL